MIFKIQINGDEKRNNSIIPFEVNVKSYQESINEWKRNESGEYFMVTNVDVNNENKTAEVTIERWDTDGFTPLHSMAYSSMTMECAKIRNEMLRRKEGR